MSGWYLLRVDLKFAWGWSIKTPTTSAAEISLLFPPPSTLIGALARGVSYILKEKWSECVFDRKRKILKSSTVKLLKFVASAHFSLDVKSLGVVPWSDITHSSAVPYQQIQHRPKREMWFGVHASGKIYSPNTSSHIVYAINETKVKEILGENWKKILKGAAYSIVAVGGKEGLTVAHKVDLLKAELIKEDSITTLYYIPKKAITDYIPRSLREEEFWDHTESSPHWSNKSREKPKRIPYILPIDKVTLTPRIIEAYPSDEGVGLTVEGSPRNSIILLKEWIV